MGIFFYAGACVEKLGVSSSVDEMQAELSFSHLIDYQKIKVDLISGCEQRARSRVDYLIDQEMMLMAKYVQTTDNTNHKFLHFKNYIDLRDKNLIEDLKNYKEDWKTWKEPACAKEVN
jgi:hypothetical protein